MRNGTRFQLVEGSAQRVVFQFVDLCSLTSSRCRDILLPSFLAGTFLQAKMLENIVHEKLANMPTLH
eukprot:m.120749 g.120749  ORF g.120749 m.120749 type:complete len:67 (-) comp17252_c0_seq2:370-570(-)